MSNTMSCQVLHGKQDLRRETRAVPRPEPGGVVVRIRQAGICGSDIHYYQDGRVGSFVLKQPFVLGHEGAGEIAAVAPGVTGLAAGVRVAIDPAHPCSVCAHCRSGRYNLCRQMRYLGSAAADPHVDGVFSEYIALPARNCHVVPDQLTYAEAAMIEPLSVALHAVRRAGDIYGATVLVTGGGTIGQLALLAARAFGAARVTLSDVSGPRRAFALAQGADAVWDPTDPDMAAQVAAYAPEGFDVIIEASGAPAAVRQALHLARRGGTIVQVGTLMNEFPLPMNLVMAKELQVLGSFRFANVFQMAIDLVAAGRIRLHPLITQAFPFAAFPQAMDLACGGGEALKVQVFI